jgi:hypothetical protein
VFVPWLASCLGLSSSWNDRLSHHHQHAQFVIIITIILIAIGKTTCNTAANKVGLLNLWRLSLSVFLLLGRQTCYLDRQWPCSDPGAITRGQSQLLKMVSKKEEESGSLVAPQGKEWDGIDFFFIEVYRVSLLQLFSRTGINCHKFKQSNTNVLSYSSVGQKSDMSLTIERDSRNGSMASFSSCPHLSAQLNSQPLPSSSNQAVWVSLTSLP